MFLEKLTKFWKMHFLLKCGQCQTPMWTGHGPNVTRRLEEQQDVTRSTLGTEVNKEKKSVINMEATDVGFICLLMPSDTDRSSFCLYRHVTPNTSPHCPFHDFFCCSCRCVFTGWHPPTPSPVQNYGNVDIEWRKSHIEFWYRSHGCSDFPKFRSVSDLEPHMKVVSSLIWKDPIPCDLCCSHCH